MIYTLHGWSFDRGVWKGTPFENAVHLELPGHGESPFTSTNLLDLSKEIAVYLEEGSTLVGWSLGATVAVLVGALYPSRVKELILYAPTPLFSGLSQPEAVVKRFLKRLRRDFFDGVRFFRTLCSGEKLSLPRLQPQRAYELLENFCYFDVRKYLEKLDQPVKVIVGEEDEITKVLGALNIFLTGKNVSLTICPCLNHFNILSYNS